MLICLTKESMDEAKDEANKTAREHDITEAWAKLVGYLYVIMRRMSANGHDPVAAKMQKIIDLTVKLDVSNPATHETIYNKQKEFDPNVKKFEDALAQLRAEHKK
jgi:hypothetical protein